MPCSSDSIDEMKRKLRSLKKLEIKIRTGSSFHSGNLDGKYSKMALVWDEFFDMHGAGNSKGKYSLEDITSKSREDFKNIVDEFFFRVYYKYYMENGIVNFHLYDPEILKWMGLPLDAGFDEIKKRFRELAKKYHPDTGGDSSRFMKLMDNYKKLVE